MDIIELRTNYWSGRSPIEITVDTANITGLGCLCAPTLWIPFQYRSYQLRRADNAPLDYVLPEIRGWLGLRGEDRLAELRGDPALVMKSSADSSASHASFQVPLDSKRIELMERCRSGDMEIRLQVWGTAFIDKTGNTPLVEKFYSNGPVELKVPQSVWVSNVLNKWKVAQTHLVEIQIEVSEAKVITSKAVEHLRAAEAHFLQHNPRETMASLFFSVRGNGCATWQKGPGQGVLHGSVG